MVVDGKLDAGSDKKAPELASVERFHKFSYVIPHKCVRNYCTYSNRSIDLSPLIISIDR